MDEHVVDTTQLRGWSRSNGLRVDAAGRAKVETAVDCAAASSRVELRRTQGYQRPAPWGLNLAQAHWITGRADHIHDCTLGEWSLASEKGANC